MHFYRCIRFVAALGVSLSVQGEEYIVNQGDNLSKILYEKNFKPLYGQKGWLKKIVAVNPRIKENHNYKIYPGMKILLETINTPPKLIVKKALFSAVDNEIKVRDPAFTPEEEFFAHGPEQISKPSTVFEESLSAQYTFWKFRASLSWKNLNTSEITQTRTSKIQVMSSTNYGAGALYIFHMDEGFDVFSSLFLDYASFKEDNSISLSRRSLLLKNFSFGADLQETYKMKFTVSDMPYLSSSALQNVDIKTTQVYTLDLSYKKTLWTKLAGKIDSQAGAVFVLPYNSSAFQNNFGLGYNAELSFKLKEQRFQIGYEYLPLGSARNKTNVQNIFWNFIWGM